MKRIMANVNLIIFISILALGCKTPSSTAVKRGANEADRRAKHLDSMLAILLNPPTPPTSKDPATESAQKKKILTDQDKIKDFREQLGPISKLGPFASRRERAKAMLIIKEGNELIEYEMDLIELLIEQATIATKEIEAGVAFGTGKFEVDPEKKFAIQSYIAVFIDSVIYQANRRPKRNLELRLICTGYSDEQDISEIGPLKGRLLQELGKVDATRTELNLALSKLRAESIAHLANQTIWERRNEFKAFDKLKITLMPTGRGEEKPNPRILDYQANDLRRRIVLFNYSLILE